MLRRIGAAVAAAALPVSSRTAHKGDHGRVLVIGGFAMAGAARLAGEAALRTGAGLVTIATSAEGAIPIVEARPELIVRPIASRHELESLIEARGCGRDRPGTRHRPARRGARSRQLIGAARPLVVDADALTLLAAAPRRRADWILTPHPGEAARLLATDSASVQRDRLGAVREIAKRYGGTCVLKGAHTLVKGADPVPWVCDRGNPGMATAGSGDVLTGIIAALLAGGAEPSVGRGGGRARSTPRQAIARRARVSGA